MADANHIGFETGLPLANSALDQQKRIAEGQPLMANDPACKQYPVCKPSCTYRPETAASKKQMTILDFQRLFRG